MRVHGDQTRGNRHKDTLGKILFGYMETILHCKNNYTVEQVALRSGGTCPTGNIQDSA